MLSHSNTTSHAYRAIGISARKHEKHRGPSKGKAELPQDKQGRQINEEIIVERAGKGVFEETALLSYCGPIH